MSAQRGIKRKNRIQNTKYRTQKTASIKIKTITESTPSKAKKCSLISYLIWADWT